MRAIDEPRPTLSGLLISWLALTASVIKAFAALPRRLMIGAADALKNAILDATARPPLPRPQSRSLPALDPVAFASALHSRANRIALRAAELINEDPCGCWSEVTQERVMTLYKSLGQEALEQALEMRVATAEMHLPPRQCARGSWAARYRRILASRGYWPGAYNVVDGEVRRR